MNELNNEELRQMIIEEMNRTYTIEEAIEGQKEEFKMIKESFDDIKDTYRLTNECRRSAIKALNTLRMRLLFQSIYSVIFNREVCELLDNINNKAFDIKKDFQNEKEVLIELKNAIELLEKYNTIICNYDISSLLVLLIEKYQLMLVKIVNEIEIFNCAVKGIDCIPADNDDKLLQINEEIDKSIKSLGLKLNKA